MSSAHGQPIESLDQTARLNQIFTAQGFNAANIDKDGSNSFALTFLENTIVRNSAKERAKWMTEGLYIGNNRKKRTPLEPGSSNLTNQKKKKSRRKHIITSRQQRQFNVYSLPKESLKYELFLPLHTLWRQYMAKLLQQANPEDRLQFILKADFHGSMISVRRSKCPSLVGLEGIVVQETKNLFRIITKQNALKNTPKANTIFAMAIQDKVYLIIGNSIICNPSDRAAKKFKDKPTIEL
ncbi:RNase P/RNase MRP complex subunit [Dimargaris xerosporica]|nr:RNase P/RNase MRP complex subunit [Dimargaris xerosporica]